MAGHEQVNTHGRARLSFANEADIDEFVVMLEKYERGEITPDQWRGFRLLRGTYGQRQSYDASMLRVKIPQGAITSALLGSVSQEVAHASPVPVTIVKHAEVMDDAGDEMAKSPSA